MTSWRPPAVFAGMVASATRPWVKYGVIGVTCLAQNFPWAVSDKVMPAVARSNGLQTEQLWLFSLLTIPFWAKILWAPLVDRWGLARWGRRKSVIIPATILAALVLALLGSVEPGPLTIGLAIGVLFFHVLLMTTQDIAVDAYVVEALRSEERALGTSIKASFEMAGHLISATSILWVHHHHGWQPAMFFASVLLILLTLPIALRREDPVVPAAATPHRASLWAFARRRDLWIVGPLLMAGGLTNGFLNLIGTTFFVDRGLPLPEVGLLMGAIYAAGELSGAFLVALLASRLGNRGVLILLAVAAIPAVVPLLLLATSADRLPFLTSALGIYLPVTLLGALHTIFTIERMGWAQGPQAGTDFTGFGTFYNFGRMLSGALGGFLLLALGYAGYFMAFGGLVVAMCLGFVFALARLSARNNASAAGASAPAISR